MRIETSRFGNVDVDEARTIRFTKGLLGFPGYTDFVLLEAGDESSFWWLQSTQKPDLAFVVTDPGLFVPTYKVPVREPQLTDLGAGSPDEVQVFVIVNKRENMLTGNLQGPLVVSVHQRLGEQLVLSDRRFTTRVPLMEIGSKMHAASA